MSNLNIEIKDDYLDYKIGDIVEFISKSKSFLYKEMTLAIGEIIDYKVVALSRTKYIVYYKINPKLLQTIFELSKDRIIKKIQDSIPELKYICKQCEKIETANNQKQIIQRKKICLECINKNNLKKSLKLKRVIISIKDKITNIKKCEYCQKEFETKNARYCSSTCRKKGMEKKKFYNNLDEVNKEIQVTKTRVFGQGNYEKVNFIKDIFKNNRSIK